MPSSPHRPAKADLLSKLDLVLLPLGKTADALRRLTDIQMRADPPSVSAADTKGGIRKGLAGRAELLLQLPENISIQANIHGATKTRISRT